MKKILLSIAIFASALTTQAQTWNMVVTTADGQTVEVKQADVKNIVFRADDQNADQVLIKEVYNGGVMNPETNKNYQYDKSITLYNNCGQVAVLNNLCVGMAFQSNAEASANDKLYKDGHLVYENEDFIPAFHGIWYFPNSLVIQPYSQVVVNIHGAIDNTKTVPASVNYANKDYYCMYDPEYGGGGNSAGNNFYNNTSYYPSPADVIPTSHYLKTVKYGMGNAWTFSVLSPAVFIFQTQGVSPKEHAENADNIWYADGVQQTSVFTSIKVKKEWVIDGVEVFNAAKLADCKKRFSADIDAGHVDLTNQLGHSLYRNVDKEATEALPENSGKLVYNYALGVDNSTDPSGIDAEASMKNGAHIIFLDTNNSTNDFHERQKCSLRGE